MSRYIISLPASRDLQAIIDYFAVENENVDAGERILQYLIKMSTTRQFSQHRKAIRSFMSGFTRTSPGWIYHFLPKYG
jgi:hypothetical protein